MKIEDPLPLLPIEQYTGPYLLAKLPTKDSALFKGVPGLAVTSLQTKSQVRVNAEPYRLVHNSPKAAEVASYLNRIPTAMRDDILLALRAGVMPFSKPEDIGKNAADFREKHFGPWVSETNTLGGQRLKDLLLRPSPAVIPATAKPPERPVAIPQNNETELELSRKYQMTFQLEVDFKGEIWDATIGINECRNGESRGEVQAVSKKDKTPRTVIHYKWPRLNGLPPTRDSISRPTANQLSEWNEAPAFLDATFRAHAIKMAREANLAQASRDGTSVTGTYINRLINKGHLRLPHYFTQRDETKDIRAGSVVKASKIDDAKLAGMQKAIEHINNVAKTYSGEIANFRPWLREEIKKTTIPALLGSEIT